MTTRATLRFIAATTAHTSGTAPRLPRAWLGAPRTRRHTVTVALARVFQVFGVYERPFVVDGAGGLA